MLPAAGMEITVRAYVLFGRFGSRDVFECATAVDDVACPVVLAHGTDDQAMPIMGARQLAERFGVQLVELLGKGHVDP